MTTTTSGGHRLCPDADRKHTKPVPAHLLGWCTAFGLTLVDTDVAIAVWHSEPSEKATPNGAAWGPAVDNSDIWFAMDWRNPAIARRVEGGRDGAIHHLLHGVEILRAAADAKLSSGQTLAIGTHEYDETIFGGYYCTLCSVVAEMDGSDLTVWPCGPLLTAGLTVKQAEAFIVALRKTYALGRWPASAAHSAATR